MPDEFSVGQVPKFDGTNFLGWKFQMSAALTACGVYEVVDGTRARPADERDELMKPWVKDNAQAMYLISKSLEYKHLESLLVCTTAKEMWDGLARIHQQNSAANKLLLMQRFHEYRMSPTDTAVQHVAKIQNMARQLLDLGENVSDLTIMAKILASLTSKFSTLQTAWDSVDPARQTLENLQERLIKEESRLDAEGGEIAAFAAVRISGGEAICSKKKEDSKSKEEKKARREKKKKNVECYVCQEKRHYARECPTRKQKKDGGGESETSGCAFIAASSVSEQPGRYSSGPSAELKNRWLKLNKRDVWYTDSGASRHVTFRREWFSEFRPERGTAISVGGDGVCEVAGEGTVIMSCLLTRTRAHLCASCMLRV
ncbi:uncharacterized protein [Temnothorax nylanderi]|uniref:uncharacterized protein n=1 Tax=Temnothorax nylanderi TaxID=102681 RepID=UPI003A8AC82D